MAEHYCCICSHQNQNCSRCRCARSGQPCTNCRRGAECRNANRQNVATQEVEEQEQEQRNPVEADDVQHQNRTEEGDNVEEAVMWMRMSSADAKQWMDKAYREVVRWSPSNIFEPPSCHASKGMIKEMTCLLNNFNEDSPLALITFKALAIIPHLFCQKTHNKLSNGDKVKIMTRRLGMWKSGEIDSLFNEAKTLQSRLDSSKNKRKRNKDRAKHLGDLMREGKVNPALRTLTDDGSGGVLPLNTQTLQQLREKHPEAKAAGETSKYIGANDSFNPVIFEKITGEMIWKKAVKTQGGAGPSGFNAKMWKTILSKNRFGETATADLCKSIALLARKMATTKCSHLEALMSSRLIPLDKAPGCRPIGIGEILRRVIGKCVMDVLKNDVRQAVGNLQVCAGHQAGGEAAIHAMRNIFQDDGCEAVLLVDASNAFNAINREAMLHNIRFKCPTFAPFVENTYCVPAELYISGGKGTDDMILSTEGTTQGDPIAMAMYALGMSFLQSKIGCKDTLVKHVAYADDLTGAGKLENVRKWWDLVATIGPEIGYNPNASKSWLIVKPEHMSRAQDIFGDSDVQITSTGQRHLGAAIGSQNFKEEYVKEKVNEWVKQITTLSQIAVSEPQAAYSAFTYGLKHRWTFLMRTVPEVGPMLQPVERAIRELFIPALVKTHTCTNEERNLLSLPPRLGGLGIINPVNIANNEFQSSQKLTTSLSNHIENQCEHGEIDQRHLQEIKKSITKERNDRQTTELTNLLPQLTETLQRKVEQAQELGASNWLSTLPIRDKGFNLNKQEFVDALALRYGWSIESLPSQCVCGSAFNPAHAMVCKKGGFICIRHDEVRDLTAKMLQEVCRDVAVEPTLLPLDGERFNYHTANTSNEARVDVSARGFWTRGQRAFFDIRVFDPQAPCHRVLTLEAAHKRNEREKTRKYGERILQVDQGSFTPLVFTTSGGMGPQAKCFYSRLADLMADKKQQPRSYIVAWMRCRLSFSLLRSALLCLRGTRTSGPKTINVCGLDFETEVSESRINVRLE